MCLLLGGSYIPMARVRKPKPMARPMYPTMGRIHMVRFGEGYERRMVGSIGI